ALLLHVAQNPGNARARGDPLQRAVHASERQVFFRARASSQHPARLRFFQSEPMPKAVATRSQASLRQPNGARGEPAPDGIRIPHGTVKSDEREEDVLHDVVHLRIAAKQAVGEAGNVRGVRPDELVERVRNRYRTEYGTVARWRTRLFGRSHR